MAKIALICPEPIREKVQGIGIRFIEMAKFLATSHEVIIWAPDVNQHDHYGTTIMPLPDLSVFETIIPGIDIVITHGHISNWYFHSLEMANKTYIPSLVIDLYDPFLIENLHYTYELGDKIFFRDRDILFNQLQKGDFFLTSSDIQRMFYIGILTGIGRLLPEIYHNDLTLRSLINNAPFGITPISKEKLNLKEHKIKGKINGISHNDIVIFFGGVYNWYDPVLLLQICVDLFKRFSNLRIIFSVNPNQKMTPQSVFNIVVDYSKEKGWTEKNVFFIPWFPYETRFEYYKDIDIAVCLHKPSLEMELSLRTRILDYMNAGIPIIATLGGESSSILKIADAALLVPHSDSNYLYESLVMLIKDDVLRQRLGENGRKWVQSNMKWEQTLKPLMDFCNNYEILSQKKSSTRKAMDSSLLIIRLYQFWKINGLRKTIKKIFYKLAQYL